MTKPKAKPVRCKCGHSRKMHEHTINEKQLDCLQLVCCNKRKHWELDGHGAHCCCPCDRYTPSRGRRVTE